MISYKVMTSLEIRSEHLRVRRPDQIAARSLERLHHCRALATEEVVGQILRQLAQSRSSSLRPKEVGISTPSGKGRFRFGSWLRVLLLTGPYKVAGLPAIAWMVPLITLSDDRFSFLMIGGLGLARGVRLARGADPRQPVGREQT